MLEQSEPKYAKDMANSANEDVRWIRASLTCISLVFNQLTFSPSLVVAELSALSNPYNEQQNNSFINFINPHVSFTFYF